MEQKNAKAATARSIMSCRVQYGLLWVYSEEDVAFRSTCPDVAPFRRKHWGRMYTLRSGTDPSTSQLVSQVINYCPGAPDAAAKLPGICPAMTISMLDRCHLMSSSLMAGWGLPVGSCLGAGRWSKLRVQIQSEEIVHYTKPSSRRTRHDAFQPVGSAFRWRRRGRLRSIRRCLTYYWSKAWIFN